MVLLSDHLPENRICTACSMVYMGCSMALWTIWLAVDNMSITNRVKLPVVQLVERLGEIGVHFVKKA